MRLSTVLCALSWIEIFNCDQKIIASRISRPNLAHCISEIVAKEISKEPKALTIVTPDDHENNFVTKDFMDDLLARSFIDTDFAFRQESTANIRINSNRLKRAVIFLVKDFEDFLEIHQKITSGVFLTTGQFLLVMVSGKLNETNEMLKMFWKKQIINVVAVYEDSEGKVLLETFELFRENSCDPNTTTVSEFKDGKFLHGNENLYPDRMKNLQCSVRVATSTTSRPYVIATPQPDDSYRLRGGAVELIRTLALALNFKLDFTYVGPEGFLYPNGSSAGVWRALQDSTADLALNNWWIKSHRLKYFDSTTSFTSEALIFVVPQGRPLAPSEKLIYPFKCRVWFFIVAIAFSGAVVIFIIQQQRKSIRAFVFGSNVRAPFMNMLTGYVGSSQNILPRRNFARFLLMMFLIYSMIIRTLYQGSYFQLMQSNRRHKEVQSIAEMVEKDFELFVEKGNEDLYQGTDPTTQRIRPISQNEIDSCLLNIRSDTSFKGGFGRSITRILYLNQISPRNARNTICKETYLTIPVVIYARKNFFLLPKLDEKILLLTAAGLTELWQYQEIHNRKRIEEQPRYQQVISIEDLIGCFQILPIGFLAGVVAFLFELIKSKFLNT